MEQSYKEKSCTLDKNGDVNNEVYWQMLRKGEPAACNEKEQRLAYEMIGAIMHKLEVHAFWRQ